jgi:hypothetical protein
MAKHFIVGTGDGYRRTFTPGSYLKWAVSTRVGWKHLTLMLFWFPVLLILRVRYRAELAEYARHRAVLAEAIREKNSNG